MRLCSQCLILSQLLDWITAMGLHRAALKEHLEAQLNVGARVVGGDTHNAYIYTAYMCRY